MVPNDTPVYAVVNAGFGIVFVLSAGSGTVHWVTGVVIARRGRIRRWLNIDHMPFAPSCSTIWSRSYACVQTGPAPTMNSSSPTPSTTPRKVFVAAAALRRFSCCASGFCRSTVTLTVSAVSNRHSHGPAITGRSMMRAPVRRSPRMYRVTGVSYT
jgi:hypothetical protein